MVFYGAVSPRDQERKKGNKRQYAAIAQEIGAPKRPIKASLFKGERQLSSIFTNSFDIENIRKKTSLEIQLRITTTKVTKEQLILCLIFFIY